MPLVITYHPRLHDIGRIVRKNLVSSYAEEQVKQVFTSAPFVSFGSGFSLRNNLVRAKVYPLPREGKGHHVVGKVDVKPTLK